MTISKTDPLKYATCSIFLFDHLRGAIFFEIISVNLLKLHMARIANSPRRNQKMKKSLVLLVMVFMMVSWVAGLGVAHSQKESALSGKVVETMNSGGYTYVLLDNEGKKTWVAVPETKVVKGSKMSFQPGAEMTNFHSKTLNRTFEKIIFSGGPIK